MCSIQLAFLRSVPCRALLFTLSVCKTLFFPLIVSTDLLHPSPAKRFRTCKVFLIYCPKCPIFNTIKTIYKCNISIVSTLKLLATKVFFFFFFFSSSSSSSSFFFFSSSSASSSSSFFFFYFMDTLYDDLLLNGNLMKRIAKGKTI